MESWTLTDFEPTLQHKKNLCVKMSNMRLAYVRVAPAAADVQIMSEVPATDRCGARTNKGGINLFLKLKKLELNQIDGRNITSVKKRVAFSKESYGVFEEKPDEDKCDMRDKKQHTGPLSRPLWGGTHDKPNVCVGDYLDACSTLHRKTLTRILPFSR